MKYAVLTLCVIAVAGCAPHATKPQDPCLKAPKTCWGMSGQAPEDIDACRQLMACYAWSMEAR